MVDLHRAGLRTDSAERVVKLLQDRPNRSPLNHDDVTP